MIDIFDNSSWKPEAVILAAGDFPSSPQPLSVLEHAPMVVCCDGAAREYIRRYGKPTAIVGDGDSLDAEFKQEYRDILHHESEQETNDLSKAFRYVRAVGKSRIAFLGTTGRREDHTIGNIALLMDYARQGADVRMLTDYGVFIPCHGEAHFRTFRGQEVSAFNFGATGLHSEGLMYPLYDLTELWQGTLNKTLGDEATVRADGWFLLFLNYSKDA